MAVRDPALVEAFDRGTSAFFREFSFLPHRDVSGGFLVPASSPEGFDVSVRAGEDGVTLETGGGFHLHFDDGGPAVELVRRALGVVLELLSADARIIELRAGGMAYRWRLELLRNGQWRRSDSIGLLIWNIFGRRSRAILQNDYFATCPLNDSPRESSDAAAG